MMKFDKCIVELLFYSARRQLSNKFSIKTNNKKYLLGHPPTYFFLHWYSRGKFEELLIACL